ncbi:DUF4232 domain-containing protein [Actinophytocola sp.]|uniref:DUF4232 domain-containing protein n=1 Tax=Actinophytocola sp. TaxID=1872138 RepID=UPI00389AE508
MATTACGARQNAASEPPPTTQPTSTSQTSSPAIGGESAPPSQDNPCTTDLLTGSVQSMGADAGNRSAILVVTNKSRQTCTLWGFGSLQLLTATKQPIPTNAERDLEPVPTLVRLKPGGEAGKLLHWTVVATGDEPTTGPCQPAAASVDVSPPDQTVPFRVDYTFGSVCDHGRLETSAYYPR